MDERENLPAKLAAQGLAAATEKRGSLVARGRAAVNDMKQQLSLTAEPDAEKLFKLGMHYFHGGEYGMPSDIEKAYEYLLKAAKLDHAEAQYELSNLIGEHREYIENWDGTEPVQWLESSAILGFGPAQYEFARDYELPEDEYAEWIEKALDWYKTQAEAGNKVWQYEYAMLLLRDDDEWCGDPEEGLRWLTASAKQDYRWACRRLGIELLKSPPNTEEVSGAIHWLEQAADLGDAVACVDLAEMYLCGHRGGLYSREPQSKLVEIDRQAAVYWYERGIQLGWSTAAYKLGSNYLYGKHLPQNLALAEKWLLQAANEGFDSAQILLGVEYESGKRFAQNNELAVHWYKKAVEKGRWPALYNLARMLEIGNGISPDLKQAISLYKRAACDGSGHKPSQRRLDELGVNWKTT